MGTPSRQTVALMSGVLLCGFFLIQGSLWAQKGVVSIEFLSQENAPPSCHRGVSLVTTPSRVGSVTTYFMADSATIRFAVRVATTTSTVDLATMSCSSDPARTG